MSYYVMFFRNPVGKYVLQVCTTLSCAVAGAERVVEELEQKLGIKAGETDPTGMFTIQPMECLGACDRAPVMMVNNDDWHEQLTPGAGAGARRCAFAAKGVKALNGCHLAIEDRPESEWKDKTTTPVKPKAMPDYEPVLTKYAFTPNGYTLDHYLKNQQGYEGLKKARGDDARAGDRRGQGVGPARPRRRRLPDRPQVAVRRQEIAEPEVHRLQRRRERAGHVQGSPADGAQPAPADRGVPHRLLRHRLEGGLHLHPRRVLPHAAHPRERDRGCAPGRISSARTSSAAASTARSTCIAAPAPTKPARRRRCSNRSRASARSRASSRRSRPSPACGRCPTAVNNVETLCNVPLVLTRGVEWFTSLGPEKNGGPKLFCVSGHVKRPGVFEAPMKVSLRELIDDYAGGMRDGHTMKAVIPGGSSVPILMPDQIDIPASFDDIAKAGSLLGSAAIIVLDDTTDMVWLAENLLHFYRHESCGKCTPCREGTDWLYRLLHRLLQGRGLGQGHRAAEERGRQHQRQDAVRLRRCRGDAGADDAQVVQAGVRGVREAAGAGAGGLPRAKQPRGGALSRWLDFLTPQLARLRRHRRRRVHRPADWRRGDGLRRAQGRGVHAAAHGPVPGRARRACSSRIADIVKLIFKEDLRPKAADTALFLAAPMISVAAAYVAFAPIPFGAASTFFGLLDEPMPLLVADINVAVLVDLRGGLDGRLRHRARRLGEQQQVFAARRAAQLGADDQLRAVVRHRARDRDPDGQLDVAARRSSISRRATSSASSRAGTSSGCSRSGSSRLPSTPSPALPRPTARRSTFPRRSRSWSPATTPNTAAWRSPCSSSPNTST